MKKPSETPWKTLSTKPIYSNKWLSLREDVAELPDGRTTIYGVVTCGSCVGILPFFDSETVLLIRQYRYVARRVTWEMPTGGVHPGESVGEAAQRELAEEIGSYIVADVVWYMSTGMHDTALMVDPDGDEVSRRAKISTTDGEENVGFVPGPREYPIFDTPFGKVGLGVCWDRHRLFITRELARSGAQIVLMIVDDDFNGTPWLPPFHASEGVFRAVEYRVAFGLGTINRISLVIDPFGRIMAEGGINERGVIVGEVFTASGGTLYTRWGDWFGWLMVVSLAAMIGLAAARRKDMA